MLLSTADIAIKRAAAAKKLRFAVCTSRFGGTYIAVKDDNGTIEVHSSEAEALARLAELTGDVEVIYETCKKV